MSHVQCEGENEKCLICGYSSIKSYPPNIEEEANQIVDWMQKAHIRNRHEIVEHICGVLSRCLRDEREKERERLSREGGS